MTAEELSELKAAWHGEWRSDGCSYLLDVDGVTIAAWWSSRDGGPVVWVDSGCRHTFRSARGCKTFTEAVASFRAEAEKVAKVYAALAGKTLV